MHDISTELLRALEATGASSSDELLDLSAREGSRWLGQLTSSTFELSLIARVRLGSPDAALSLNGAGRLSLLRGFGLGGALATSPHAVTVATSLVEHPPLSD